MTLNHPLGFIGSRVKMDFYYFFIDSMRILATIRIGGMVKPFPRTPTLRAKRGINPSLCSQ